MTRSEQVVERTTPVNAPLGEGEVRTAAPHSGFNGEKHGEEPRYSPDPMRETDRYRLVTPFTLRL